MNYHVTGKYNFDVVYSERLKEVIIEPWKMNLLAVSWNLHFLFIAGYHNIYVYTILPNAQIDPNCEVEILTVSGQLEGTINQILVKKFEGYDTLFCVDMNAKLTIFKYIQKKFVRMQLDNTIPVKNDNTTWSLDVTDGQNKFIGVGSNAHTVTLWDENLNKRVIDAHKNNVPCMQFSPCGEFVASVSIDKTAAVFHTKTMKKISEYTLKNWGWSINWVIKSKVLGYKATEGSKAGDKSIFEQLNQYLLIVTDEIHLYLIDPSSGEKDLDIEHRLFKTREMKLLSQYLYKQIKIAIKQMYGRYNYCKFLTNHSLIILAAQNTPFLHLLKVVYDQDTQQFMIGDDSCAIFKKSIMGLEVIEKPDESILLNFVYVYVLLEDKQIKLLEVKFKNELHSFKTLLESDYLC